MSYKLSRYVAAIMTMHRNGKSQRKIADDLGLTQYAVQKVVKKCEAKKTNAKRKRKIIECDNVDSDTDKEKGPKVKRKRKIVYCDKDEVDSDIQEIRKESESLKSLKDTYVQDNRKFIESLKKALDVEWHKMKVEVLDTIADVFPKRMEDIVRTYISEFKM